MFSIKLTRFLYSIFIVIILSSCGRNTNTVFINDKKQQNLIFFKTYIIYTHNKNLDKRMSYNTNQDIFKAVKISHFYCVEVIHNRYTFEVTKIINEGKCSH